MTKKSQLIGPYSLNDLKEKGLNKQSFHSSSEPVIGVKIYEDGIDTTKYKMSGIYMWGVKINSAYIPIYVGKAANIPERLFQHIIRFSGGEYFIPEWNEIINPNRDFHLLKKNYLSNPTHMPKGLLHFPTGNFDFDSFDKNQSIIDTVNNVKQNFFACWKYLSDYEKSARFEEDALATAIKKEKLISSHYKTDTEKTTFIEDFLHLVYTRGELLGTNLGIL
jgi:hypothetical protein